MDVEHVEPVQALDSGRRSRARRIATAALPAVFLVAVVVTAMIGQEGRPDATATDDGRAAAVASDIATPPPETLAPEQVALREAGFPTRALGLQVRSVAETLALRDAGETRDRVVAIAGWLTVPPEPTCGTDVAIDTGGMYALGASCTRKTLLVDDPEPVLALENGVLHPLGVPEIRLRPVGLPGVSLAAVGAAQRRGDDEAIQPQQSIVLGRFADPRLVACQVSMPSCGTSFAIERVLWADGEWRLRRPELYPGTIEADSSGVVRWLTIDTAIRRGAIVLSEVIHRRDDLAIIGPA